MPDVIITADVVKLHVQTRHGYRTTFLNLGLETTTGDKGTGRLPEVPAGVVRLRLSKPGWIPGDVDLAEGASVKDVVLQRHVNIRVATSNVPTTLNLYLFDGAGSELKLRPARRGRRLGSSMMSMVYMGRSTVIGVSDRVARAELRDPRTDEVVRASAVVLAADGVTVLSF